jgi:hypothetical protein
MIVRRMLLFVLIVAGTAAARAEVVRIEVNSRADIPQGQTFGQAGGYEKLSGKIYFAVDPRNSANLIVADIDNAPKNAAGKVEFSSDFYIIKPKEMSKGNGTLLLEIPNRGTKSMLGTFNFATGSQDPQTAGQFGDSFLMQQGFTLLWVGWQFDMPNREGLLRVYLPTARSENGQRITGLVRADFEPKETIFDASLGDKNHLAYAVSNPADPVNILTVRDTQTGMRRTIPRSEWDFTPDGRSVHMAAGFEPKKIYEVVYESQDPPVAGLGSAAVRDAVSKLKYGSVPELAIGAGAIQRTIGFGSSQSGRFLRTYLYYGFNEDESHRKVFDGVMTHVSGSGRGSFNIRFAQPSRDLDPWANFFYPVNVFPFTDVAQTDPETGKSDGLLTHATKPQFLPKIIYTNSSYEYWGRAASLFHTTIDGKEDAQLMSNVRAYLFAGGSHGVAAFPPRQTTGQQLTDPLNYRFAQRRLLLSMNQWITDGTEPPPSAVPRIDNNTLVRRDGLKFPNIPGVSVPDTPQQGYRMDYGSDFVSKGLVTNEPPKLGAIFPSLVPQVDADGNDLAGVRLPELAVPLATYTGWNLFNDKSGPSNVMATEAGSFIPFPRTRAERERAGDPRPSIEERYKDKDAYLELIRKSANELVSKGYLIEEDVTHIVEQARTRWDWIMTKP